MITTKGITMHRLTELKQKTPSFSLRKRRSRRVSARGLTSCRSISGSRFVRRVSLLLLLLSTLFWAAGCENYYSSSLGYYDPASYYGANPFDFLDHDRRYYRGPGYSYGRVYYVWEPGYWAFHTGGSPPRGPGLAGATGALPNPGQLQWIHGRYIAQDG